MVPDRQQDSKEEGSGTLSPPTSESNWNLPDRAARSQPVANQSPSASFDTRHAQPSHAEPSFLQDLEKAIVGWEGPDDPENPRNWPRTQKWTVLLLVSSMTLISPFASSVFAPAAAFMSEDFHNTSTILTTFSVSVYVLGYAIGPLFLSPLSEMYGRQIILNIATIHFVLWQIGCALAPNISALIVFRLLSGMGGSACLTLGGGAIADMFEKENRGKAMSIFTFGPLFGPVLGPVAGGFIAQQVGWRWVFWTLLIAAGSCTAVILILYRETNPTILIRRKTHRLGQQLSRTDLRSCYEVTSAARSPASIMIFALARPLRMLCRSPVIGPLAIYLALIYGCLYLLFTTVTLVFQKTYHWTPDLAGLSYLGLGLGTMCGQILFGLTSDRLLLKLVSRNNGVYQPEMRLSMCLLYACFVPVSFFWYGWSIQAQVHWILPIIGLWPFGFGMIGIFMSIQTYVVDAYPMFAASGIAAITVTRSFFGAFLPLVGPPVFDTLGYGWGNSLLGFITLALVPIPVLFQRYGGGLRQKYPVNFE